MEHFVIIVNEFQPLTIVTKRSILDAAAVLDSPLRKCKKNTYWVAILMIFLSNECGIEKRKPNPQIVKVPNFLKRAENRAYWAGRKHLF